MIVASEQMASSWRSSSDWSAVSKFCQQSSKNELVIIVTPSILDDENGGLYGYGYRPITTESKKLIGLILINTEL